MASYIHIGHFCQLLRIAWREKFKKNNYYFAPVNTEFWLDFLKSKKEEKWKLCTLLTCTYHVICGGDFKFFTAFCGRNVCNAGDFACSAGEREKQMYLGGKHSLILRLTVLHYRLCYDFCASSEILIFEWYYSLYLSIFCMWGKLYVSHLSTGKRFVMREILYSWWMRGRNSVQVGDSLSISGELIALYWFLCFSKV